MSSAEEYQDKYHNMIAEMIRDKSNGIIKKYSYTTINREMIEDKLFTRDKKYKLYNSISERCPEDIDHNEWEKVISKVFLNQGSTKRSGGKKQ
jgi:hypothetical protein